MLYYLVEAIVIIVSVPGILAAFLLSLVKQIGDGRSNESGMAEGFMWILIFNVIFYGGLISYL